MLRRILRSLMTFAAILVVYQAYVLLAVPWMEPPLQTRKQTRATQGELGLAAGAVSKYQALLSHYFPAGHWSQKQPPIVLASSSEQAMLVMDKYDRYDDGVVEIGQFALLVFPTPWRSGITPPRDAIIMEATEKARLQFDEFLPERGRIGRITSGEFPGRITIRSDMREPGPEDDLAVETADFRMNSKLMYTTSPVRFRMGRNVGGGREMEIRFLSDEHVERHESGLKIAGLDSIEVRNDVRLRLFLAADGLLPGDKKRPAPESDSVVRSPAEGGNEVPVDRGSEELRGGQEAAPVEVTCSGPFHFDFVRYVASFDRDVEVRQVRMDGPSDQLSAQQLDIHFAPRQDSGVVGEPDSSDPTKRQQRDIGRLEPAAVVAQGHPVVVNSPTRQAEARGARVQLGLRDRRVVVSGGPDTMLVYGPNVLRAPAIEYQHPVPPKGYPAATKIGRFRATGPGTLDYVFDPAKPEQRFRATWQTAVELGRYQGQPLLTLTGRPQLGVANMGALAAERIQVYLRELDGPAAAGNALPLPGQIAGTGKVQVVPDRLAATGNVQIESAELTGTTEELLVTFRGEPSAATAVEASSGATNSVAGGDPSRSRPEQFELAGPGERPEQAYHIDTDRLQILVAVRGKRMAPTHLSCDGNVVFREVPLVAAAAAEKPLEVRGGQLTVDNLDSDMHVTILADPLGGTGGAGGTQLSDGTGLAQVSARGMTLLADTVQLDQRENRMWVAGPGKANMLVARDLAGRPAASSFPLEITWQGGLNFDGKFVVTDRDVLVEGADDWVRCDRLTARLTREVRFGEHIDQSAVDMAEVECQGQVLMDHRSRDELGLSSHERMRLTRLTINQQTGAISGDGPGEIRSTHFATQMSVFGGPAATAKPNQVAPPPGVPGGKLKFLRVEFQRQLTGNLYLRELKFLDRVRAVYGPVDAWEQELDGSQPEVLPPESMTLTCDELALNEDPLAAHGAANIQNAAGRPLGPVQMRANGNVRIYGRSETGDEFGAQADSASYEQAKDVFLLTGTGLERAQVWQRRGPGDNSKPYSAREIRYDRSKGEISGRGVQSLEFVPANQPQNARGPAAPAR